MRGQISAEKLDRVIVSIGSRASTSVPWESVEAIEYDAPGEFSEALRLAEAGLLDEARSAFDGLRSDARLRRPLRQEALYRYAALSLRDGACDEAVPAFESLVESFPEGRYLVEAIRGLSRCLLTDGRIDETEEALGRIAASAPATGRLDAEIKLVRARIDEARHDYEAAIGRFEAARSDTWLDSGQRFDAALGVARCLLAEGRVSQAHDLYAQLVGEPAPPLVLAGAWNGLGDLELARGRAERDEQRILDAAYCYLRGVVLYLPDAGEPSTERKRALAGAAECFTSLSQLATDPKEKTRLRARALALELELRGR